MRVVILAGGFGSRISEESHLKPKPMIEIGERPILWHVMKIYSYFGFNDFIICLGYKGYCIKEYFAHYYLHEADVTFDFRKPEGKIIHNNKAEPWSVTLVNTGLDTMTGGRVKRVQSYVGNETFMLTYGDGLADIDINQLVSYHRENGKLATITSVQPSGRFGAVDIAEDNIVVDFREKPRGDNSWINAGFFVMEPEIFDYIENDETILEEEPLHRLAHSDELMAFKHTGFWMPMDSMRDKVNLETLWKDHKAPWKMWDSTENV